jgi:hypothetical protein
MVLLATLSQPTFSQALSYNCPATAFCMKAAVTSSTFSLPIARGFSRLSSVAFSFYTGVGKEAITFNHPLAGAAPAGDNDLLRYHLSIGSMRTPTFDVEGVCEQWYRTRMAMQILDRDDNTIDISPHDFRNTRGVFMLNLERAVNEDPDVGHTGQTTRNGSQLTIQLKGCQDPVGANQLMVFVTCFYDSIVQLSASGVALLD